MEEVTVSTVCLSTATGALHKAVVSGDSGAHLVEEIQLFLDPEPVRNLLLAPEQVARALLTRRGWGAGSLLGVQRSLSLSFPGRSVCRLLRGHLEDSPSQLQHL